MANYNAQLQSTEQFEELTDADLMVVVGGVDPILSAGGIGSTVGSAGKGNLGGAVSNSGGAINASSAVILTGIVVKGTGQTLIDAGNSGALG